jgi:tetratricopeptide (TPR) repeat protein
VSAESDFEAALVLLKSGDLAASASAAHALWAQSPQARVAALLALIAERQGRRDEAAQWLTRAAELDPRSAGIRHQLGTTLAAGGNIDDALAAWRTALALAPDRGATWLALGQALLAKRDSDDYLPGLTALRKAAAFEATHDAATAAFVEGVRPSATGDAPAVGPVGAAAAAPATGPSTGEAAGRVALSIVMCTIDPARAARAQASYRAALGDTPHEFVVIGSPSSLAAGYADGLRRATGDVVVFSHDDVEILIDDFGERLRAHLARCDIVGIAGATDVRGPAWAQAGHPYLHGAVGYPAGTGFEAHVYSTLGPLVPGARVLDGVLLAMRREVAERTGWDGVAFDGFHGYDIDFCLRAGEQGQRLAVACDLGVLHHSRGAFDARWETYARTLMRRHPALDQPVSERTFAFAAKLESRAALAAYFRGLRAALDALAPLGVASPGTGSP